MFSLLYRIAIHVLGIVDAERIHHFFLRFLQLAGRSARYRIIRTPTRLLVSGESTSSLPSKRAPVMVFGLPFENRVGLAAGLDKNAEALEGLQLLDFSFLEVGTVTPLEQAGNPRPRLFRNYSDQLIFNAMGFNNFGVEAMKRTIDRSRPYLRSGLLLGINIGKNALTSLEDAHRDYAHCTRELHARADYLTVNVSSPNTKGLRGLQSIASLGPILTAVFEELARAASATPVLVKLAPEIDEESMGELIASVEQNFPVAGWILTNTLQRDCPFPESAMKVGGVSGESLIPAAREALRIGTKYSKKPLLSSGGILSLEEAQLRLQMGAALVQIYSGLIFRGPALVQQLARELR